MKFILYSIFFLMSFSCANKVAGTDDSAEQKGDDDVPEVLEAGNNNAVGKLYLRTLMMSSPNGSALTINWIYLGDDGIIIYDPADGVNPVNYVTERTNNADNIGKYKIQGNQLLITWDSGKTSNFLLEFKDGDINILDGGIMVRQTGVPAGFTLNGQYAAGTAKKTMGNTFTYVFKDDGSFILKRLGAVRTEQGNEKSQDELSGRYSITGNTLSLHFNDGTKEKAVIGIRDMKGGYRYLIINKSSFRMEKI